MKWMFVGYFYSIIIDVTAVVVVVVNFIEKSMDCFTVE